MPSRLEHHKLQRSRVNQLAILVALVFFVLIARLWYLQIALGDDLLKAAESNRIKTVRLRAPRGMIVDRKGRILATSRPQFIVLAIPELLEANPDAKKTLAGLLDVTPGELESTIEEDTTRPGTPVRVAVDVDIATVTRILERWMMLPGVSVELGQIRHYPDGPAVAHLVGYLGLISQEQYEAARKAGKDYGLGDYVGKTGLEKQYEDELRGIDGRKRIEVNAFGRYIRDLGDTASIPGRTLTLTVDRDLQMAAYKALGDQVGALVALDPRNGDVLAMVSKPDYDPNIFTRKVSVRDWNAIVKNPHKPLQNRSVYNSYPPGSTFKPITAIAALVHHACGRDTVVSCPGSFHLGKFRFGCWKTHGRVDLIQAIAQSCDVWFYTVGKRLGIEKLAETARQFGIGSATGIDLPDESRRGDGRVGTMPDPEWKRRRFDEPWYPGETVISAIGQGFIQATPLQMAVVCCALANNGSVPTPHLVSKISESGGAVLRRVQPRTRRHVSADEKYFELVRQAMHETVAGERGTGKICNLPDIAVAGKTGSAENPHGAPHGWFICFAPVDDPQIAIACIVEQGGHGATSAAPVCKAVLEVFFGLKKPEEIRQYGVNGD